MICHTLKPPAGSHVALIEFADLECPMCARQNPTIKDAAAKYHVPWLRHDFPAADARLEFSGGGERAVVRHEGKGWATNIATTSSPTRSTSKPRTICGRSRKSSPQQHGVALPFVIDPQGKLADEVKADYALGRAVGRTSDTDRVGRDRRTGGAPPYVEVTDYNKLYTILDEATAETGHGKK